MVVVVLGGVMILGGGDTWWRLYFEVVVALMVVGEGQAERKAEIDLLYSMVVTLDTSHGERSPLNPDAY